MIVFWRRGLGGRQAPQDLVHSALHSGHVGLEAGDVGPQGRDVGLQGGDVGLEHRDVGFHGGDVEVAWPKDQNLAGPEAENRLVIASGHFGPYALRCGETSLLFYDGAYPNPKVPCV